MISYFICMVYIYNSYGLFVWFGFVKYNTCTCIGFSSHNVLFKILFLINFLETDCVFGNIKAFKQEIAFLVSQ